MAQLPISVRSTNGTAVELSILQGLQISDSSVPTNVMLTFGPSMSFYAQTNHSGGGPGGIQSEGAWNNIGGWAIVGGQDFHWASGGQLGYSGKTHEIIKLQYDFVPSSFTNFDNSGLWGYSKFLAFYDQGGNANDSAVDFHMAGFRTEIVTNNGVNVLAIYPEIGQPLPTAEWKHSYIDAVTPIRGGEFGTNSFNYRAAVFTNSLTVGTNTASGVSSVFTANGDTAIKGQFQITDPSDGGETTAMVIVDPGANAIVLGRQSITGGKSLQNFKIIDRANLTWFAVSPAGGTVTMPQGAVTGNFWKCTDSSGDGAWLPVTNLSTLVVGNVTNTPSFTIVNTNWISGQLYTNLTGRPIEVKCQAILFAATTGVGGAAQLGLQTNGVNMYSVLISPTATTSVNDDRLISGWIPSGVTFAFTNLSTGTGNTATPQWGQYMVY